MIHPHALSALFSVSFCSELWHDRPIQHCIYISNEIVNQCGLHQAIVELFEFDNVAKDVNYGRIRIRKLTPSLQTSGVGLEILVANGFEDSVFVTFGYLAKATKELDCDF